MKKLFDKFYNLLFTSRADQREDLKAIHCPSCRVWHLRVRDILKAQFRKSFFSILVNLSLITITILALTGYLKLFLNELLELFKKLY